MVLLVSDKGCIRRLWGSEQWAGRVCSVICQVHTNIFMAVKTGPISDAFRLRGDPRERATRPAHGLCGDWPSRRREGWLGQSPTPPSLFRECCAWADRVLVCTAVDWHSLLQWTCSPTH